MSGTTTKTAPQSEKVQISSRIDKEVIDRLDAKGAFLAQVFVFLICRKNTNILSIIVHEMLIGVRTVSRRRLQQKYEEGEEEATLYPTN